MGNALIDIIIGVIIAAFAVVVIHSEIEKHSKHSKHSK